MTRRGCFESLSVTLLTRVASDGGSLNSWLGFRHPVNLDHSGISDFKEWSRPREVPRLRWSNLSLEAQFEAYKDFEGQLPLVLEESSACFQDGWIEEHIMEPFKAERVIFIAHTERSDSIMSTKLTTFLKNVNKNSQSAWAYLKDEFFLQRHPDLMMACPPLPAFLQQHDQFDLMPPSLRPRNATFLWGGRFSRSKLHVDRYNWTGTIKVLKGEKFFRLIPPGQHDRHLEATMAPCETALECVAYESPKDLFEAVPPHVPLWEVKLTAGDALIIPSGWWHQAVNLGNTVAFASGLITPGGGSWSAVAEVVRFHAAAHPDWKWGKLPAVPSSSLSSKEATRIFRRFINSLPENAFKKAEMWTKARQDL